MLHATPIQIHEEQVGEDIHITEADVNAVIKSLKTGKAPGEDDFRPEKLKAMNIYGVRWLTRECKVACSTGQAPKQRQTSVIIPIHKNTQNVYFVASITRYITASMAHE